MSTETDNVERLRSAEKIGGEVHRMARAAGIAPIGITWDKGQRIAKRAHHVLEVFRSTAVITVKLSDDEMKSYPNGLHRTRTEAKLAAMVRDLTRRLETPGASALAKGASNLHEPKQG